MILFFLCSLFFPGSHGGGPGHELVLISGSFTEISSVPMNSQLECLASCFADAQCEVASLVGGLCKKMIPGSVLGSSGGTSLAYVDPAYKSESKIQKQEILTIYFYDGMKCQTSMRGN